MEETGSSHMKVGRAMIKMVNNGYIVDTALANQYGCLLSQQPLISKAICLESK